MAPKAAPLVSVVTPVYNGAEFLSECIQSVLDQTYQHWKYTIVDNCSTDGSLEIARKFAAADPRIRVVRNEKHLPIIANHNAAAQHISPDSEYCKFVFADDWIYPTCLEEMVKLAELSPSTGLVGAYGTDGRNLLWTGVQGQMFDIMPPSMHSVLPGADACRSKLLGGPYLFGSMTSLLVRSKYIRARPQFFNERNLHADQEVCFDVLSDSDFGFVHQVLTFTRIREKSTGSFANDFNSVILGDFVICLKYGPVFLEALEFRKRRAEMSRMYHQTLARNVLRFRRDTFWKYHRDTLAAFDSKIDYSLLARQTVVDFFRVMLRPRAFIQGMSRWWRPAPRKSGELAKPKA